MKIPNTPLATLALALSVSLTLPVQAQEQEQQQRQQQRPKPDFAKMAASMGVPEQALKQCMRGERTEGQRPARPDAAKINACLVEAGHDVTEEKVTETLAAFAPRRRSN